MAFSSLQHGGTEITLGGPTVPFKTHLVHYG